jgi:acyl-CoA reductase-like NAD-dependent aldehyde dehydrogenase
MSMDRPTILKLLHDQRSYFASGITKDPSFRLDQLKVLRNAIRSCEDAILHALQQDLRKPAFEAYGGDIAIVVNEIDHAVRHLRRWAKPRRVRTPLAHLPARCFVRSEPYGVALIIGPWNFPVQLLLTPLVGAMAAGNCAVLKPSIAAPHTSRVIAQVIAEHFDPAYCSVVEGGAESAQMLLEERFDTVFFTGGPATGKLVMAAAAKHLTPVTLELGGKNPCIVDADADLGVAARRIVWGKFFNAGQSCVAVDYLLVDRRVKQELLSRIISTVRSFYGEDPSQSPDFARIVDELHFDRLARLLAAGEVLIGGTTDRAARYIAPTVIDGITGSEPIMEDEIFGPLLPVIEYGDLSEAVDFVNSRPRPLALYVFSRDRTRQEQVLHLTSSGGACINDTVIHETITGLPFGGVGDSGLGAYHGRASFDAFSHERSIVRNGFLVDILLRYPPYRDRLRWLKKLF